VIASISMNTLRFSYRGLSPHKFTPMPGVHNRLQRTAPAPPLNRSVRPQSSEVDEVQRFQMIIHRRQGGGGSEDI
jgi:hypothetical protein